MCEVNDDLKYENVKMGHYILIIQNKMNLAQVNKNLRNLQIVSKAYI